MAAPVVKKPANQVSNVETAVTPLTLEVTSGEAHEWAASGLPAGLALAKATGKVTGTPTTAEKAKVKISAENVGKEKSAEVEFEWEVKVALSVVTKPEHQYADKSRAIQTLAVSATHTPTEYKSSGLPSGLSINSGTGHITGTPTEKGTSKVKLSVENAGGVSPEVEFEWTVEDSETEEATEHQINNVRSTWAATGGWVSKL